LELILENWRKFLTEEQGFEQDELDYFQMGHSKSEYHPSWDYEANEQPDFLSQEAYEIALQDAQRLSNQLGLGALALYFVQGERFQEHVARYISGTYSSPVIVITDIVTNQDEARLTLFHELGHAYVESTGEELGEEQEEEFVEEFALLYLRNPKSGLEYLMNLGEQNETPT
jgi:hypothetical protein